MAQRTSGRRRDDAAAALSRTATLCPVCSQPMRPERGHYTCDRCRMVGLTCCEGAPLPAPGD